MRLSISIIVELRISLNFSVAMQRDLRSIIMKKKQFWIAAYLGMVMMVSGCSSSSSHDDRVTKATVIKNYSNIVYASYEDSLTKAQDLLVAVQALVDAPSEETLEAAKAAWIAARIPYGQTEGYRFSDGPIDNDEGPEGRINAWPIDESYIDYVNGNASSGIVNDTSVEITSENLLALNQSHSDEEVATGYHAIEFLLWGQDLSDGAGAGQRSFTDYSSAENHVRRGQYLIAITQILVSDLQTLVDAWAPGGGSYRTEFEQLSENEAITRIFKGIATLAASELSQERMNAALVVKSKEFEHSCFSDTTNTDLEQNAQSIVNVYLGSYQRSNGSIVSGASLYELVKQTNSDLANSCRTNVLAGLSAVQDIPSPFDQQILNEASSGYQRISTAVDIVTNSGATLVDAGAALGLTINTDI